MRAVRAGTSKGEIQLKEHCRVLIIGWDGATYDLLQPLLRNGRLPNLNRLLEKGAGGPMNSTVPPYTGPAWSTFATGLNPGRHGLFGWRGRYVPASNELGYRRQPLDSSRLSGKTFWSVLSRHGKRIGVVNFPMVYPVEPVNGLLIGGLLAPSLDSDFIYPREERHELMKVAPKYQLDVNFNIARSGDLDGYLEHISTLAEQRIAAVLHFWERERWDLFMAVFTEPDRLQHVFWHCMDPNHPAYNEELGRRWGNVITNLYERLDTTLGDMMSMAGPDTTTLVLSDHGFGPAYYRIHLNLWLKELGLLHTQRLKVGDREMETIDWRRTRAFAGETYEHCIYINLRGRDHFGLVSPGQEYHNLARFLADELVKLKHSPSEEPIITQVWPSDQLYWGEYTFYGPDLVYETANGIYLHSDRINPVQLVEPVTWQTGCHRNMGIYAMAGPGVRQGWTASASLQDVYPTVLLLLGVPIPPSLDGVPLVHCFEPDYLQIKQAAEIPVAGAYTSQEVIQLEKRLRSIGYID